MHGRKLVAALVPILLLLAGQAPPAFSPAVQAAREDLIAGRYLKGIDALRTAAFGPDGQVRDPFAAQLFRQFSPFIGGEADPAAAAPARDTPDPAWAARIAAATPVAAIPEIVRRARRTSIVILNEAHDSPRDRAFAAEVARALRPLGYDTLAVETLSNGTAAGQTASAAEQLRQDGFARLSTGSYSADPVFAGFLREAMALGYRPVAYEQRPAQSAGGGIEEREQAQTDNLMATVFMPTPRAKVLIYVGHSHVAEAPVMSSNGRATAWLAARLKQATGIDPLTIEQTTLREGGARVSAAYAAASRAMGPRASVFLAAGEPVHVGDLPTDLQVVHPPRAERQGRPAFLWRRGYRPLAIPAAYRPSDGRVLVQAFAADAPADAVPLDQVVLTAGRPVPPLLVPAGRVRFAVQR